MIELKDAGVDLTAFSGFPVKGGKSQIDLVSNDIAGIKRVAKKNDWCLSKVKKGFLVQGTNEIGAIQKIPSKLSNEKINVVAVDAVAAGKGRFVKLKIIKDLNYAIVRQK